MKRKINSKKFRKEVFSYESIRRCVVCCVFCFAVGRGSLSFFIVFIIGLIMSLGLGLIEHLYDFLYKLIRFIYRRYFKIYFDGLKKGKKKIEDLA